MDRGQLLNSPEMVLRAAMQGWQSGMWTAMPAIVQSVDLTRGTLVAQLAIQGVITNPDNTQTNVDITPLVDVPICFPSAGGFALTFPITEGDEVLVVFASRCIDAWWFYGGSDNVPMETRMHDLSDGFAIPGPKSFPNVLPSISTTAVQLRNTAGTAYFGVNEAGLLQMKNSVQSLKGVLTALNTALTTFATSCEAAVIEPTLAPAATALAAALAVVLTDIGVLLQ